jgi:hypothetical protein
MKNTPTPETKPPTQQQIAALAYALWLDAGSPVGRDVELWLEAERQLQTPVDAVTRDHIRADPDRPLPDEDPALHGELERELDEITAPRAGRSPTAL